MSTGFQRASNEDKLELSEATVPARRDCIGKSIRAPEKWPTSRRSLKSFVSKSRNGIPTCSAPFFFLMPMAQPCAAALLQAFPRNTQRRSTECRSVLASDLAARQPIEKNPLLSVTSPRMPSGRAFGIRRFVTVYVLAGPRQLLRRMARSWERSRSIIGSRVLRSRSICSSLRTPLIWQESLSNTTAPKAELRAAEASSIAHLSNACRRLPMLQSSEPTGPGTT